MSSLFSSLSPLTIVFYVLSILALIEAHVYWRMSINKRSTTKKITAMSTIITILIIPILATIVVGIILGIPLAFLVSNALVSGLIVLVGTYGLLFYMFSSIELKKYTEISAKDKKIIAGVTIAILFLSSVLWQIAEHVGLNSIEIESIELGSLVEESKIDSAVEVGE